MSADAALHSVDEALAAVAALATPLEVEEAPLEAALGRALAVAARCPQPLPRFAQSAVDGYAVRHEDLQRGLPSLPVCGTIAAGPQRAPQRLHAGEALRIFTGAMLPEGADTVVRQELTERDGDEVRVRGAVALGADVRREGEELRAGATLAEPGDALTPGLVGALAAAGLATVFVRRAPRIVVLITGDEVVPVGAPLALGQVPDANGPLVASYLRAWGAPALRVTPVADDPALLREALARAFDEADVVLTTGGVSVGDFDHVPRVAEALGAERRCWRVRQKPGMPLYVAERGGRMLFGLPGNPAAVLVNLHVYVRAALDHLAGLDPRARWRVIAAPHGLAREAQKTCWLRGRAVLSDDARWHLEPLGGQASHMLGNLAHASVLARVPSRAEAPDEPALLRCTSLRPGVY